MHCATAVAYCKSYCRAIGAASMGFSDRDRGTIINFINVIALFKISNDDVDTFAATVLVTLVDVFYFNTYVSLASLFFSTRKKLQSLE